jgi:hypothetical protein
MSLISHLSRTKSAMVGCLHKVFEAEANGAAALSRAHCA